MPTPDCACLYGDPAAIAAFEIECMAQTSAPEAARLSASDADEVQQRLRHKLLVDIPDQPGRVPSRSVRGQDEG